MKYIFPYVIKNGAGETLIFKELLPEADGEKLTGENFVMPESGPPMHVHWLQDEGFTVLKGKIGYQLGDGPQQFATAGESVVFKRGVPHRFWNAGEEILHCSAWVKPANSFVFFISAVFDAQHKSGSSQPGILDAAYLLTRYRSEYDMTDIPLFVKRVIFPIVYGYGRLFGKYKHFADAPMPVKE